MRTLLLTAVILGMTSAAFAQRSAFQSGEGTTIVYLDSPAICVHLADSNASLAYTRRSSAVRNFWGVEAFAKASSGITTLFSDKPKVPEGGLSFIAGTKDPFRLGTGAGGTNRVITADWALIDTGYGLSTFHTSP